MKPTRSILRFLGTGTSTGVPQLLCGCPVCRSTDSHDKRLRTSAVLEIAGKRLLIDCGPDFRSQILEAGQPPLDALLVTHSHYDHLGGIDDLRPYCHRKADGFPVYCSGSVAGDIRRRLPYCFGNQYYPGAPRFDLRVIGTDTFDFEGIAITPLPVMHAPALEILGYKIGRLCYITDCKTMPADTLRTITGCDTLVINALRHTPHNSHMNLRDALDVIEVVKPRQAFLTHISHELGLYSEIEPTLPDHVHLAYDTLTTEIEN